MRKSFFIALLFSFICSIACAAAPAPATASAPASAAAAASNPSPVVLTPDQAKHALEVLDDPKARAKLADTLRAIAAAGALSAPPAAASAPAAPAASPASAASAVLAAIAVKNGLVSQLSRQAAVSLRSAGDAVRRSAAALLDVHSVGSWWRYEIASPQGRTQLRELASTLCAALLPAWLIGALLARALRRRINALGGKIERSDAASTGGVDSAGEAAAALDDVSKQPSTYGTDVDAEQAARTQRNTAHATRQWSLLQRLPFALLQTLLKALPLVVSVLIAVFAASILTDDGTAEERVIDTLIQIFAIARLVSLGCELLFAADAPKLRLLPMSDTTATFVERWLVRLTAVLALGIACAEAPVPLGLTPDAHEGIVKAVTLIGHIMLALLILQLRKPVAQWIRAWSERAHVFAFLGHWLADVWAYIAAFAVMALWFVWALDVQNGYRVLLDRGGISVAILVGARIVAIVTSGVLGRIFRSSNGESGSIALQRAHRYYALLRRLASFVILVVALTFVLSAWDIHPWQSLFASDIGSRLLSAFVTVAVAACLAIVVWETINGAIERRLKRWMARGDLLRAARLRTLLPMFRTTLFVCIALVIGLTGLSEIGVNVAPLLAGASIFGVALGFGSQKLVQDFITGMFLLMENAMQVGDWVTVAGVSGTVEYLSIRTVRLRGGDGSLYTVPFSSVTTVNNTNRGLGNAAVRVSIAYGQDVELAAKTLQEIGASLREDPQFKDGIVSDFSFWGVDQVDGAMVTLAGQIQCRDSARWPVQREFNKRILETFRERGIEIANPLRTTMVPPPAGSSAAGPESDASGTVADAERKEEPNAEGNAEPNRDPKNSKTESEAQSNAPREARTGSIERRKA
ncbi:small-conductance mechanosensitive channel [Trinickia symbiotica]|uniref:Mechanosensitive ion channel protein n=1 Tax=Trinickia symbiotica TaxID=863227 RepID=A0A2N7XAU0_9BURK|nr:mechanosensitive ion channel domain-containing protein [Trinickia symbiotica]PMS38731.1 mechanosensitive ion channel protein [Trinickia symbiotica]PPK46762.1 small-conductance mechanosensitive channel [Trinickia symbiotica]